MSCQSPACRECQPGPGDTDRPVFEAHMYAGCPGCGQVFFVLLREFDRVKADHMAVCPGRRKGRP